MLKTSSTGAALSPAATSTGARVPRSKPRAHDGGVRSAVQGTAVFAVFALCVAVVLGGCSKGGDSSGAGTDAGARADAMPPGLDVGDGVDRPDALEAGPDAARPVPVDGTLAADVGPTPDGSPSADGEAPDAGPFGGGRPATIHLPADHDRSRRWPLLILLHGFRINSVLIQRQMPFQRLVDELGFIFVVPDGLPNADGFQRWNTDEPDGPDDVAYLRALVDEAVTRYGADPGRVYLAGHSNGGYMAYRIACEAPELVAAIVPVAGSQLSPVERCADGPPVSILHLHGDQDPQVPFEGSERAPGAVALTERWAERLACDAPVDSGPFDYDTAVAGAETTVRTHASCREGTVVELWTGEAVGHLNLPSMDALRAIMRFVTTHGRPPEPNPTVE